VSKSAPSFRVLVVGDHPWKDHIGWIKPNSDGGYETVRVLGGPVMYKVTLDNGHECFASAINIRKLRNCAGAEP
jgi:hypothetical protein